MDPTRVILVSGGSRGLGQAIVTHFLAMGDCVATFSRRTAPCVERWQRDPSTAERFLYREVDAANAEALRSLVVAVLDRFGRIDVLVNNAGLAHESVLPLATDEQIDQMLHVNLRASLLLARECSRAMLDQGSGQIINVSSIIAERGSTGLSVYAATKAGQIGMTRSLARELGRRQIRVNAIAPGYMETEMSESLTPEERQRIVRRTPLGRLGRPEDVVPCIEFLLSPAAAFITGQVLTIDGGASI